MIGGFGGYRAEPEETPQEEQQPQQPAMIDNEFALNLLSVLETGLKDVEARYESVKNSLVALIELDPITGMYVGKVGALMESVRALVASRNADYLHAKGVIDGLNPVKLLSDVRAEIVRQHGEGMKDVQSEIDAFLREVTTLIEAIDAKRKVDAVAHANKLDVILAKQESVNKQVGFIDNKVSEELAKSSLDRQDTKSAIQAGVMDYGRIVNDSLESAKQLKKIIFSIMGLFIFVGVLGILAFLNRTEAVQELQAKNYEQAKMIEAQQATIETLSKGKGKGNKSNK